MLRDNNNRKVEGLLIDNNNRKVWGLLRAIRKENKGLAERQ